MRNRELLVPASSLEVLKIAVIFGADAVYIGGRGIRTPCEGKELFYGRHERRRAVCA